ncbi:MAG: hypothetical protein LC737_03975, partial [Chloroflexi bacterium]|nr:hypothetical protein [Chloroflexota bacterium]
MTVWSPRSNSISFPSVIRNTAIVFAVLGLAGYLALRWVPNSPTEALLLVLVLVGAPIAFAAPELMLPVLMVSAAVVPFAIKTGTESDINVAMLLVIVMLVVWLARMLLRRDVSWVAPRTYVPLLALLGVALLSLINSYIIWPFDVPRASNMLTVQIGAIALMVLSIGAFIWMANVIRSDKWLKVFVVGMQLISSSYVSLALIPGAPFPFVNLNGILSIWSGSMSLALLLFHRTLNPQWKLLSMATLVLYVLWGVMHLEWVSGWLPLVTLLCV